MVLLSKMIVKNISHVSTPSSGSSIILETKRIETPLGPMNLCGNSDGICLLEFADRKKLDGELKNLAKRLNAVIADGDNQLFKTVETQLAGYFEGKRKAFEIPLFTTGTAFQKKVWQQLLTIPYGKTRSYKEQAIAVGNADAVRAVATANGMNRIAIIIPCHRVIGSNGNLTGYAGGLWRKKYLLELESNSLTLF